LPSSRRIVEDAWLQDSDNSQFIQVADLVVHAAFQSVVRQPAGAFMWNWCPDRFEIAGQHPPLRKTPPGCVDHRRGLLLVSQIRSTPYGGPDLASTMIRHDRVPREALDLTVVLPGGRLSARKPTKRPTGRSFSLTSRLLHSHGI